ncbi:MAG: helix-turn-helix domain-containing protein [Nanoarchaeota archaeon]
MNDILIDLQTVGFTKNEARAYVKLIELGEAKTGFLCDNLKIPSSKIYYILNSLFIKGLIGFKDFKGSRVYFANNPSTVRTLFLKKKEELELVESKINNSIKTLEKLPKQNIALTNYKYFEGINGIKSLWFEAMAMIDKNDCIDVLTGTKNSFEQLTDFYITEIHKRRVAKKVNTRIILPKGAMNEGKLRKKTGRVEIKYYNKESEGEFAVSKNFVILQHTSKTTGIPRGFIINDKIFAITFKEIFENLWEKAEN